MQKSGSSKVDSSSLIDLKAELFRKQEEFKTQKLQSQNSGFIKGKSSSSTKKPSLFSKKNAGVSQRAEKDYEEKVEEENVFERSRKALENKAKLYEQIASSSGISEEDGSGLYLVDFQKKSIDDFEERREKERKEKEEMERRELEEEQRQLAEPVPPPDTEEEEWVDYVDAFGRSRRCLRQDLPELQKQDETLQVKKRKIDDKVQRGCKEFQQLRDKSGGNTHLLSADMKCEIDREKWEKEEKEKMEEEKQGPIHYADVQHNEIRSHGVGYYKFDKEEDVRQEQMDELNKLRQETKDERSKSERIKEKRKAALAARLAKVKQRKREKLGLPEPEAEDDSSGEDIGPKVEEQAKKEPEPLTRDDSWRATVQSSRDWDKGKQLTLERSEQVWLEKQRAEREEEFAPPTFYYDTPSLPKHNSKMKNKPKENNPKGKTWKGYVKQENEIKTVIGEQLNKIRNNKDLESSKTSDQVSQKDTDVTEAKDLSKEMLLDSVKTEEESHQSSVEPCHNMQSTSSLNPLHATNVPPPNFNVPPPNYMAPPPNFSAPPPVFNVPPPNLNFPPPNIGIPPPGHAQHLPTSSLPASNFPKVSQEYVQENSVPSVETKTSATTSFVNSNQAGQNVEKQAGEKVRQKFVPKLDIIDTRLMGGEGD